LDDTIQKAVAGVKGSKHSLVKVQRMVTRNGKTFLQTFNVLPSEFQAGDKVDSQTGKTFETAEDFGKYTKKLSSDDREGLIELARHHGVTWNEHANPGINWMRASMAIKEHLKTGKPFHLQTVFQPQQQKADKAPVAKITIQGAHNFSSVDDFKKFSKQIEPGERKKIMEDAKKQGLTWKEHPTNESINWMRAAMAINSHIKSGKIFQVSGKTTPQGDGSKPTPSGQNQPALTVPANTQPTPQPAPAKPSLPKIDQYFNALGLAHQEDNGAYFVGSGFKTIKNKYGYDEPAPGYIKLAEIKVEPKWGAGHYIQVQSAFLDKDTVKGSLHGRWGATADPTDKHWYIPFSSLPDVFKNFDNGMIDASIAPTVKAVFEKADVDRLIKKDQTPAGAYQFEMPKGMSSKLSLFDHQKRGVEFAINNKHATLGMAVGLGKTLTSITAAKKLLNDGKVKRFLIVAPSSVKYNWKEEIEGFSDAKAAVLSSEDLRKKDAEDRWKEAENSQFVVVNYDMLRKPEIADRLKKLCPDGIIADEAHKLKNYDTQQTKAFAERWKKSDYVWFLTATPFPNGQPRETYTMLSHLRFDKVGGWRNFASKYVVFESNRFGATPVLLKNTKQLREEMKDIVFIRTHNSPDVNSSLPKDRHSTFYLEMNNEQKKMYNAMAKDIVSEITELEKQGFNASSAAVLAKLKRLEQVAIDPDMLQTDFSKINPKKLFPKEEWAVNTTLDHLDDPANRGMIIFCDMKLPLDKIKHGLIDGKVDPSQIAVISGDIKPSERTEVQRKLENGDVKVVLCTSAAEEGMNLQKGAHTMIHLDVPWVPKSITQREGRVLRQGQTNSYTTFLSPIVTGTVEDKKRAKLGMKVGTIEDLLGAGSAGSVANNVASDDKAKKLSLSDIKSIIGGGIK
jgi:superfamily II DNA or RNA helicase